MSQKTFEDYLKATPAERRKMNMNEILGEERLANVRKQMLNEINDMTIDDEIYKKIKSYDKRIFDFNEQNNFKPAHYPVKEDGLYVTIRCGLSGIYQTLDRFENGDWQLRVLDGSRIIAYSKDKVEL